MNSVFWEGRYLTLSIETSGIPLILDCLLHNEAVTLNTLYWVNSTSHTMVDFVSELRYSGCAEDQEI